MAVRRKAPTKTPEQAHERRLIEAAQGDPSRFEALYELHFERIYVFIIRRVRDRDLAEDLASEVFHKALAGLPRYEFRGAPFVAWLYRIAANAVVDRSKSSARETPRDQLEQDCEAAPPPDLAEIEQRARLFRLVDDLSGEQRRVVFARFVEEQSIREIALRMGKSEGAIKQLQFRALANLRKQMEGAYA